MKQGRPHYQLGHLLTGTTKEMGEVAHGYLAYGGEFHVNEEVRTLTHHMKVSMNPTWIG